MSVSSQVYTLTDNVVYLLHKRHFIRGKIVECGRNYAALQQFLKILDDFRIISLFFYIIIINIRLFITFKTMVFIDWQVLLLYCCSRPRLSIMKVH